jgi:hypothetical protein
MVQVFIRSNAPAYGGLWWLCMNRLVRTVGKFIVVGVCTLYARPTISNMGETLRN